MSYTAKILSPLEFKSHHDEDGEEYLSIQGYANTVTKDRAGDVIPVDAWRKSSAMGDYMKNPIILAYHDHSRPIGKMMDYEIDEKGLRIQARISKGAGDIYHLIKDGVLSTFSVGFRINDAEYKEADDTFYIKDVSLHEISVVSVPCNQDSVFEVAKSMDSQSFKEFQTNFKPSGQNNIVKEEKNMDINIQEMMEQLNASAASAASAAVKDTLDAEKAATAQAQKDAQEKADAEKAQKELAASSAKEAASSLVAELQEKMNADTADFQKLVKAQNDTIVSLKEEIAQVVAARSNPVTAVAKAVRGNDADFSKTADELMFVSTIKKVAMEDTMRFKAVNQSSSIEVSSEAYETEFSTNLMRDIQAKLVVAPLFSEMAMNQANMTIPIRPDRTTASWVNASDYGTDASTGSEITVALTEKTLKTFKLAAKVYLTEETEEDTIIALLPILRQDLVEAHAASIDAAFLIGDGSGKPKGLVTQAAAITAGTGDATHTSAAKADGSVKVTAKMLIESRRKLGLYGINLGDLYLVVSQDAYWDLILDDEWADVQQVGSVATKLNGEVGNVYGMPVIVSNGFEAKGTNVAYAVICYAKNFVVPRQRGVTVRSDFDVEKDRQVFVATQRLNLEPLIEHSAGNGKGVIEITYAAS